MKKCRRPPSPLLYLAHALDADAAAVRHPRVGSQGVYPIGSAVIFRDTVIAVSHGSETLEYPPYDDFLKRLDKDKDGRRSLEEWSHDADFKDHFGWIDMDEDGLQEVVLAPDHAARLSRRSLPAQERRHHHDARPPDRDGLQERPQQGRRRRVLRVAGRCRRQGLHPEPHRQDHRAEGRSAVGGPGGQRPRRARLGDARHRRRPDLRSNA